jgi:hypothetical protein
VTDTNTITLQIGGSLALLLQPAPAIGHVIVTAHFGQFTATGVGDMAYTLPVGMLVTAQVAYVDAGGNPAVIDGAVTWASSNDTVATAVVDSGDSTICTVSAPGAVGSAQITATADADLGAGVKTLVTLLDITVVAGEAVAGTISITGTPQPIPPG